MTTIEQAHALIDKLASEGFYGSVTFQFKNGEVSLMFGRGPRSRAERSLAAV